MSATQSAPQKGPLFDEGAADLSGPAPYAMSAADYLRRSRREEFRRIREFSNGCFSRYPTEHRPDLKGKLLSPDDRHHEAAVFELVMYEFLCRSGLSVEIHPKLGSDRSRRPDYLVWCGDKHRFLLELALATEASDRESRKGKLFAAIYDAVNSLESPDFFLWLRKSGSPDMEINKRKLTNELMSWLATLNYDHLLENNDLDRLPRYTYSEKGLTLEFIALPKTPEARGRHATRTLATTGVAAQWSRTATIIESTLRKKANKYGHHNESYVVAINVLTTTMDEGDVMRALEGVWLKKNAAPTNQRLSGALIVRGLEAWNLGRVRWKLYHNPWALRPLRPGLLDLPQFVWNAGQARSVEGVEIWETLGLWEGWPEDKLRKVR